MVLRRYARWLHTGWPAGTVEPLPEVHDDGTTAVPGLRVTGDLTGVPLLKLAADSGARAAQAIAAELGGPGGGPALVDGALVDVAVVGGGVSGIACALEARRLGLSCVVLEAARPFATIANFPRGKPIFTYPPELVPEGALQPAGEVKEALLADLEAQRTAAGVEVVEARVDRVERAPGALLVHHADGRVTRARRVVLAIGRSGDFRRLGVPGEDLDSVTNRLHDPADHAGRRVLVVGGGDAAAEAALALARAGARVTLCHRGPALVRPKPELRQALEALAAAGGLALRLSTRVRRIEPGRVVVDGAAGEEVLEVEAVFTMLGRAAPLDLFRRSGVPIRGEWRPRRVAAFAAFLLLCAALYLWKQAGSPLFPAAPDRFPNTAPGLLAALGVDVDDRASLLGTLAWSMRSPGFYYTLCYSLVVVVFGVRRIRRRRTPYVTWQTLTLMTVQVVPLFLLPELVLPNLGYRGLFADGAGRAVADHLFPLYTASDADWPAWGHPRAYWKAYGLVLAWPLFFYNVCDPSLPTFPWAWLAIGSAQTFVLIPLLVRRWGKGAYCGWLCSCGALAETLGDAHRSKMPHGPGWNRLNLVGQALLALAFVLLGLRLAAWAAPGSAAGRWFELLFEGTAGGRFVNPLAYKWLVDVGLAGVLGVGCYFWLSGRVWCRFACPLAALMHVYARFSRFRIFADKPRCISCNVCTSVCHQGVDVMNFASRGQPVEDPQCVRCGACVHACPTGTLTFGRLGPDGAPVLDRLVASPVHLRPGARPLPLARR
ncbi:MAG: NAD(P)-binding domain-containing protein [Planctomycetes bacterium]|nr:NAD(P)-binding domain-containing protein [Planctomycetota bacterium]